MLRVAAQLFVMEKGGSGEVWSEKTGTQKNLWVLKWKVKGFSKLRADLIQDPKLVWQQKMPMLTAT